MDNIINNKANLYVLKLNNSSTLYYFNNSSNELAQIINSITDNQRASGIDFIKREETPLKFKNVSKQDVINWFCFNTENEQALKRLNFIK